MKISIIAAVICSFVPSILGTDDSLVKEEQWTTRLVGKTDAGNVVEWIKDGEKILVTHKDCGITILNKHGYIEKSRQGSSATNCESGVEFLPDGSIIQAVNPKSNVNTMSYIQSLDSADLSQLWNTSVVGTIEGTPKVGSYIYLVHNYFKDETSHEAYLSLLSHEGQNLYSIKKDNIKFSPISIQTNPPRGPYGAGNKNKNDLVAWGKLFSPGLDFQAQGSNYFFQLPKTFDGNFTGLQSSIRNGAVTGFTRSAPELTYLNTNVYYSLYLNKIRCWVSDSVDKIYNWGQSPNLKIDIPSNDKGGNLIPPPNSPTISSDGKMLFVAGSHKNPGVHAYNVAFNTSSVAWSHDATYVASKMKLAFNDDVLFYVESSIDDKASKIVGVKAKNGDVCFEHYVEYKSFTEFSILDDSYIVYGLHGTSSDETFISAIKIKADAGDIFTPTSTPSVAPSLLPSASPTISPTVKPTTAKPTQPKDSSSTNGINSFSIMTLLFTVCLEYIVN